MGMYFLHDGKDQTGPFTLEELKEKGISPNQLVWSEGLADWTKASNVSSLKTVIALNPPVFHKMSAIERIGYGLGQHVFQWMVIAILVLSAMVYYWNSGKRNPSSMQSFGVSFGDPEHLNPTDFLQASGAYHPNVWGEQEEINGTVANLAKHTNYKDVHIKVYYYSPTRSIVDSKEYILYDYFPYGISKSFTLKIKKPSAAVSCSWEAVAASYY